MRTTKRLIRKILRILLAILSCFILCGFVPVSAETDNINSGFIFDELYDIEYINDMISSFDEYDSDSIHVSAYYKRSDMTEPVPYDSTIKHDPNYTYNFSYYINIPDTISKDTIFNYDFKFGSGVNDIGSSIVYFVRYSNSNWLNSFSLTPDIKKNTNNTVLYSSSDVTAKNDFNYIVIDLKNVSFKYYGYGFLPTSLTFEPVSESGLLSGIIGVLKSIWETIKNLPSLIANALTSLFQWIVDSIVAMKDFLGNLLRSIIDGLISLGQLLVDALVTLGNFIIDGLKMLFIPDDSFFSEYFDKLYKFFSDKLGFLMAPFNIMIDFINKFLSISDGSGNIVIKDFVLFDTVLIKATTYDLKSAFNQILGGHYNIYYAFVDCIILFGFVNFTKRKFDSIVGGGQQ